MYNTIKENVTGTLIEKKSKFIANIFKIDDEADAIDIINKTKKEHRKANHNVYAYMVLKDGQIISRYSDDKEPKGTARKTSFILTKPKQFM
jgi:putative IMPACT (imprinted ancient) family translation regulator